MDRISTELFSSIVDALDASGALPKHIVTSDRTASAAATVGGRGIILALDKPGVTAEVVDVRELSRREIAFVFHRPLSVGMGFLFCLRTHQNGKLDAIACMVMRWSPLGGGRFSMVARFGQKIRSPLAPDQAARVLAADLLCRQLGNPNAGAE